MSVFDRTMAELSGDELRLGAYHAALRRTELLAEGKVWLADRLADVAVLFVEERDRRKALGREVDAGIAEAAGVSAGEARLLRPAGLRRRQRRS